MPSKPDSLLQFVQDEMVLFQQARQRFPDLFPPDVNLHSIPYFGNILHAEVLTVALNPSWREFDPIRGWPQTLGARALADRLIDYFDLQEAGPHQFFERLQPALGLLGFSYQGGAAHIDLLPYPTLFLGPMNEAQRLAFGELVSGSLNHLDRVLRFCRAVKLVIVIDFCFPTPDAPNAETFSFIAQDASPFSKYIRDDGVLPPIFRGGGSSEMYPRVLQHREMLRECLQSGQVLEF